MYIKRTIENSISEFSKIFPVVYIGGPRQVGKTTVFEEFCKKSNRQIISLDSFNDRELAQKDPEIFLQKYSGDLLIDEVQYAPQLFSCIKQIVDKNKVCGQFFLTGSVHFSLMKNITESLAGRVGIMKLLGFSQEEKLNIVASRGFIPTKAYLDEKEELLKDKSCNYLFHEIWKGTYPGLYNLDDNSWSKFYDSYLQTYISRDIVNYTNVNNEVDFYRFMKVLAARTGQEVNHSTLARELGISSVTVKSWLSILVASGLVFLLPPYYKNLTSRVVKSPKLHFLDLGLVCFLLGYSNPTIAENCPMSGALLESYVVSEIVKSYYHRGQTPNLYYYRDKEQREIDVLLEEDGLLNPMEIKSKSNPNKDDIRHFEVIDKVLKVPRGCGAVLCRASSYLPLTKQDYLVPISYI